MALLGHGEGNDYGLIHDQCIAVACCATAHCSLYNACEHLNFNYPPFPFQYFMSFCGYTAMHKQKYHLANHNKYAYSCGLFLSQCNMFLYNRFYCIYSKSRKIVRKYSLVSIFEL